MSAGALESRRLPSDRLLAGVVFLAAAAIYATTVLRGPGLGDTAKFQFVGKLLGIPHATGYPAYVLVSKLASLVPVGNLATRLNVFSSACAAAAVVLVFLTLRTLSVRRVPAVAASLFFALTPTLWSQAVIAEVYGLQELLTALAVLCWIRWWTLDQRHWLIAAVAVEAASLGNHMLTLVLGPASLFILWRGRHRLTGRDLRVLAACALIPVALYCTLYWRTAVQPAAYIEVPIHSISDLRYLLTGAQFEGLMFAFSFGHVITTRIPMAWDQLWAQFSWLLLVIACGVVTMRDRTVAMFLALIAVADIFIAVNYRIPDIFIYFLPAWTVGALFLGVGLDTVLGWVKPRWLVLACTVIACLLPLWPLRANWHGADQSGGLPVARQVDRAIAAVPNNAIILSSADQYDVSELVWYFLLGEGRGAEHEVSLYHDYDVKGVCRYLNDGSSLDTTWLRYEAYLHGTHVPRADRPPAGLRVFVVNDKERPALERAGFRLTSSGVPGLSEVQPPASC